MQPERPLTSFDLKALYDGYYWCVWVGSAIPFAYLGALELIPVGSVSTLLWGMFFSHSIIALLSAAALGRKAPSIIRAIGWGEAKSLRVMIAMLLAILLGLGVFALVWFGLVIFFRIPAYRVRVNWLYGPHKKDYKRRYAELRAAELAQMPSSGTG